MTALTPESGLEKMDDSVLLGYDLSLPHKNNRHNAHGKDAESENNAGLCFRSRNVEDPTNPFHNDGSFRVKFAQVKIHLGEMLDGNSVTRILPWFWNHQYPDLLCFCLFLISAKYCPSGSVQKKAHNGTGLSFGQNWRD
jgi:hypothetical protein